MLGLANDRKPRHSETTVGDEIESIPRRYIIQHRRKTMDEQQLEALMKRITQYLISELDKRGDLVSRVEDLEDTINDDNIEIITEDRVKEIAADEAIEAINNAEVNVDISA